MNKKRFLLDCQIAESRKRAREVLDRFHVKSPSAIDVETFACLLGKLQVKVGGLTGADGRLVATLDKGGVIRVASDRNRGRYRFTIAHEIGHFLLHQSKTIDRTDLEQDFSVWHNTTEEAEANYFAAELLMPQSLFQPRCRGAGVLPSLSLLDSLAEEFCTSLTATAFQYWEYTSEPVAVVISEGENIKSFRGFKEGWPRIRWGQIHKDSAAAERLSGMYPDSSRMVRTPAYAWLEGFDYSNKDIREDSRYLEYYNTTITLLWIDEDLR